MGRSTQVGVIGIRKFPHHRDAQDRKAERPPRSLNRPSGGLLYVRSAAPPAFYAPVRSDVLRFA